MRGYVRLPARFVGGAQEVIVRPLRVKEAKLTNEFEARSEQESLAGREGGYADPYALYRRWFEAWGGAQNGGTGEPVGADEIEELWRRWFAGTARGLRGGGSGGYGAAGSLGPLWEQMAQSISEEAASEGELPKDPVELFLRWYETTNEKWTKAADDLLKNEEVLESNARLQEDFARSYRELRRASEEGLKKLQIPSRSDVARVAKLVVGVENKVDRIEEAFGEFVYGGAEPATAESVRSLEERMDRLEGKMDRILAALEKESG